MARKAAPRRPTKKTSAAAPPPPPPAFAQALARLTPVKPLGHNQDALAKLEEDFGWPFPREARRLLLGLQSYALQAGAANLLSFEELKKLNGIGTSEDATTWTCRRLGLFTIASDAQGNRFCMDVADRGGLAPVYWLSVKWGLAASHTPLFSSASDALHAFALYTGGQDARDAERDVERLTAELAELRKRRPTPQFGRNEALARLEAAFGGGAKKEDGAGPSAEDEGKLAGALEAAKERYKQLWMPFIEQFSRWHLFWRLLWNGPNSLTVVTESLDAPLVVAWRAAAPLGGAIASGRVDALQTELAGKSGVTPPPRTLVAFAAARTVAGDAQGAKAAVDAWDENVLGPKPPILTRGARKSGAPTGAMAEVQWDKALKLSKKQADRFLAAIGAQFASDLKKHGTTNMLGATKAAVRPAGDGRNVVEAGLGHVPLEVRKALFEGKPVTLSGQFLRQLTRELSRRLHEPKERVDRTLTRLRNVLEEHLNAHVNLTVPYVGTFRIKNEPAATGVSRFYLIVDVAPQLVEAAQKTVLHQVSADFHADIPYE